MNTQFENWSELLHLAVTQPGSLMLAYSRFWTYSLGNQLAALIQCRMRDIEPSPLNTYAGWQSLNRQVKKGSKAISLCIPLTRKRKGEDGEDETFISGFMWKPRWFTLSMTDGEPVEMPTIPDWDRERALINLQITEISFNHLSGNVQGYAKGRSIAISPIAALPMKTLLHETAHVLLGHTGSGEFQDGEQIAASLMEVEAEAVAMLLCETLNLDGAEYCRGYIQHWLKDDVIPEKSAQRILGVADRVLRAGRE